MYRNPDHTIPHDILARWAAHSTNPTRVVGTKQTKHVLGAYPCSLCCFGLIYIYMTANTMEARLNKKMNHIGILMGGGKMMMKTFATQAEAIDYLNDPTNEVESTISMSTNTKNQIDVAYNVSDQQYAKYQTECRRVKDEVFMLMALAHGT